MINFDSIRNLDNIKNFQALQIALLQVGVSADIVNNCTTMEAIIAELQKATYGQMGDAIFFGDKTMHIGDSVLKVDANGDVRIDNYLSKTQKNVVFSNYVPLEITHSKGDNYSFKIRNSYIKHNGSTGIVYRRVDDKGIVVAEENEGEWLHCHYRRDILDDGTPYVVYKYASSDPEDVFDPPKPVMNVDSGNPTSLGVIDADFTSKDAVTLMRRYPVVKGWYEDRFGPNFDIQDITSKTGRFDEPITINDESIKKHKVALLNKVEELLSTIRSQIKKLKNIDLEVAFGKGVGNMTNIHIEDSLIVIDRHNAIGLDSMSNADIEKYIYFLTCLTGKFDHYIISSHSNTTSYKVKKAVSKVKKMFTPKLDDAPVDDGHNM